MLTSTFSSLPLLRSSPPDLLHPHHRPGSVSALLHQLLPAGRPREPVARRGGDPVRLSPLPHPHRRLLLHSGGGGRGRGGVPRV